ncbi:hypothetical protein I4U23_018662 [Adineta vaga]|nr:hypothetical protein I4U23_018662 [Adineta vaga]
MKNMNPSTNFSSYLLPSVFNPRYHQHLNHLNDMAFTHTKMLQEIIEKRSVESSSPPPPSSSSSNSPMAATSNDSIQQQKTSHSYFDDNQHEEQRQGKEFLVKRSKINDDDDEDDDNHLSKRSRKQSKPQQLVTEKSQSDDDDEQLSSEEEIGEVNSDQEKQNTFSNHQSPIIPFSPQNVPFLSYIQDLARTNNITSPTAMTQFLENLQKELFSAVHNATIDTKRIPPPPPPIPVSSLPPMFSQTVHHHHHPYFSQILFNNSFINHYPPPPPPPPPSLMRFGNPSTDRPFPFHLATPKKRRTKVTDTRLSPRIGSKIIPLDDLIDDDKSSSNHSYESATSNHRRQASTIEFNTYQISIL